MTTNFDLLSPEEFKKLKNGVAWVALLIAGADGKIDSVEVSWASKIAKIRSYSTPEVLHEFYTAVGEDFDELLQKLIESTPKDAKARTAIVVDKLAELDPIIEKLGPALGAEVYQSFVSFATHVAKASGGFLRMWSISYEENKYINLPMLTERHYVEE